MTSRRRASGLYVPAGGGGGSLTPTYLGTAADGWEGGTGSNSSSDASISITPGTNVLLLYLIAAIAQTSTIFNAATMSGGSLTWTKIGNSTSASGYVPVAAGFYATVGGSDPGTFSAALSTSWLDCNFRASIWKIAGYNTSTPIGGKVFTSANGGNGAQSATLDAAPTSSDITFAVNDTDENSNAFSTFGTGTWTQNGNNTGSGRNQASNWGYRESSTSATVPWSDVNSGSDNFGSAQACVVVKV